MRGVFAVLVSSLAVLCMLYVLVSEDRNAPSSSELMQRKKPLTPLTVWCKP